MASAIESQNPIGSIGCTDYAKYSNCNECLAAGCSMTTSDSCQSMCPMDISCWAAPDNADGKQVASICEARDAQIAQDKLCEEQTTCEECGKNNCNWGFYGPPDNAATANGICINYHGGMLQFSPLECKPKCDPCPIVDCLPDHKPVTTPAAPGECCGTTVCEPTPCAGTVCPAIAIDCQPGFKAVETPPAAGECCPTLECKQDCTLVRCAGPPTCPAGEKLESTRGPDDCCEEHKCVPNCDSVRCPVPLCLEGYIQKSSPPADGECCATIECVKPPPVVEVKPTDNVRTQEELETVGAASFTHLSCAAAFTAAVAALLH